MPTPRPEVPEAPTLPARPGWLRFGVLGALLIGLPLAGMIWHGYNLGPYFSFPPRTFLSPAPTPSGEEFGQAAKAIAERVIEMRNMEGVELAVMVALVVLLAGIGLSALLLLFLLANLGRHVLRGWRGRLTGPGSTALERRSFPRWGWVAMAWTAAWWVIAWTRLPGLGWVQPHTFTPLWLGYITIVNAWSHARGGRSLLVESPRKLAALYALSAGFWWVFEYLNRFVQNWTYVGTEGYAPWQYVVAASLSFGTVLPAVAGTQALLWTFAPLRVAYTRMWRLRVWGWVGRLAAAVILLVASASLLMVGVEPWREFLYPMLWVAPLLLVMASNALLGRRHFLSGLREGDWRLPVTWGLAALICGGFWEMWNFYSFARWQYLVPFVNGLHVFEMPLFGYLGYLPFGWECAVVAGWVLNPAPADATATEAATDAVESGPDAAGQGAVPTLPAAAGAGARTGG